MIARGTIFALLAGAAVSPCAHAQDFPTKPIRMIVSFPPGGATDIFSRAVGAELSRTLGQQVIVDNRPGAGTTIAAALVARAAPDGHTLLFTDLSTHLITASLYKSLAYDPLRDFEAVSPVNTSPLMLVAHPSVPARDVRQVVALAKRNPGITMGHSGVGTVTHMTGEKFRLRNGISVTTVAYKGGSTPIVALLGGEIAMVMATIPASIQYVRAGKLRPIGLAAAQRSRHLPDIPTIAETVKGVEGAVNSGVLAPKGTPASVVRRLNAEIARASEVPRVKEVYAVNVADTVRMTPEEMRADMDREVRIWADVVATAGVQAK